MGNNIPLVVVIMLLVDVIIVAGLVFIITRTLYKRFQAEQQARADNVIQLAKERAKTIEVEARDEALKLIQEADEEIKERRKEVNRENDRLQNRQSELDKKTDRLEQREQALNRRQSSVDRRANEIETLHEKTMEELNRVAQMTVEEARGELLAQVEKTARDDMARIVRQIESEAKEEGEKRAREIIADSIQRVASDHVAEVTTSVVQLPNEEMKGRIVGRNGRNIRAFEQVAGVDVIVDDTPESVTVSCFDSVRREIARRSLERLILDGRIHPAYIEKVFAAETREMEKTLKEAGEQAIYDAGIPSLHPEIVKKLGRLKFRTSYGQNQLAHAVETAKLAAVISNELGANEELARLGGLLHDIGKAMDHNTEGTHAKIGAEFVTRYGVSKKVANIIASHHHEEDQETIEAIIVEAADAISGARPGARREDLENYIKRLRALEDIANAYEGVEQTYAIQAGREVRIIVRPEQIDDYAAMKMAKDIAQQIEDTMQYPGQIKVTVIRETRAVGTAR
ncbi:MAG: ribonuclease Y [Anaerolineae bacterium]|nr:ribonuclease Y [Anaerolineae bacterium]